MDLACGRGGDLFKYKDAFGKGTQIYGVDIDAEAIAEAKRRVKSKGVSGITLAVADISNPDLDTRDWGAPYDMIVCNFAAHYFFRSREALNSFARLINRFSKKDTIVWIIMPEGIELVKLLAQKGTRSGDKVSIKNETYNLSSTLKDMYKVGGQVDYKLHGTTYFQTAEPGANIITEGTSHEYFADTGALLESLGITAEPPMDYRGRFDIIKEDLFARWGSRHGNELTEHQKEISFTNKSILMKRLDVPSAKPVKGDKQIPESELKTIEASLGQVIPYDRISDSDKKVLDLLNEAVPA